MRLSIIAPLMLLSAESLSEQPPPAPPVPVHMCGDDVAPSTEKILPGYGGGGFRVTTANPQAQAFFDNGMQLGHAFAHSASIAAFAEARRLDPLCAMCTWGEAWASGPTINYTISAADVVKLKVVADTAERRAAAGSIKERQMIAALQLRYVDGGGKGSGDIAFARAMDGLARTYSDDDEIATIAADAWMIPASLREEKANLPRAVALLETVLKRNPNYTPAIHFYIHATEMSGFPSRAEPYADRLAALAPSASHLIHMPSHTYYWDGRYQDAVDANVAAVALGVANAKRLKLPDPPGVWQLPYHPHNVQFGVGAALLSGDAKDAIALSGPFIMAAAHYPKAPAFAQMGGGTGYFAMGRYEDTATVMAMPDPGAAVPFMRAYRHYARGEAMARVGNAAAVRAEAAQIPDSVGTFRKEDQTLHATAMMRIAKLVLTGRAAMLDGRPDLAAKAYAKAVKIEESKLFDDLSDPPAWWYPVRRSLAAAFLAAKRPADALREANAALKRRPLDPITTMVRADAETALGDATGAAKDRLLAKRNWHGDQALFSAALI